MTGNITEGRDEHVVTLAFYSGEIRVQNPHDTELN